MHTKPYLSSVSVQFFLKNETNPRNSPFKHWKRSFEFHCISSCSRGALTGSLHFTPFSFSFSTFYSFVPFLDAPECRNFSVLSEPNRHYSYGIGWKSDSFLKKGWYRFQSPLYTRMIDNCIAIRNCSTIRTGWLNGTLPSIENGIVEGEVCFSTWFHCCFERVQIRVRKCAEAFYVYELPPSPNTRPSRYCAREWTK